MAEAVPSERMEGDGEKEELAKKICTAMCYDVEHARIEDRDVYTGRFLFALKLKDGSATSAIVQFYNNKVVSVMMFGVTNATD